jgi:hypothetical protein
LPLSESICAKEVCIDRYAIIREPSEYVPKCSNEVADRENDDDNADNPEGIAHDNLPHNIVVVLLAYVFEFAFIL